MIASPKLSLDAAAAVARAAGIEPLVLGDAIEGEAREVARAQAAIAHRWRAATGRCGRRRCCCPAAKPP